MKSKLPIIATLASVVCTGLPLQAQQTQMQNRIEILGAITAAQCNVNAGVLTEDEANEALNMVITKDPYLETAYEWAVNSDNARIAVGGMLAYFDDDCKDNTLTEEILNKVLVPYLN